MNEAEQTSSNESILKAAERLRKKRLSRSESETMDLIRELEIRRVQLDMQKNHIENGSRAKSEIEKFIAIYDMAPMGYFIIDTPGNITSVNFKGAEMLGKERAELLKCNFRDFLKNDCTTIFDEFIQRLIDSEIPGTCKLWMNRTNSSNPVLLHIEGVKSMRQDNYLLTAIDITDQERAEQQLKNSEIRYRRLFESSLAGIMILDGQSGKILDANPFLTVLLGYTTEELIGKYLWQIGINISTSHSLNAITELLEKGYMHIDDLPVKTRDGKQLFIEAAGVIFTAGNEKIIQINFHDITRRKASEEKLKENEIRLSELNATKDKFFSIIAHDLKNSFNSIIGLGNILSEKVMKKDYDEIEAFAEIIQSSSWKAMNLLTNLLEWSRSQTGRIDFNPRKVLFIEIVSEVCDLVKEWASEKMITINVEDFQNAILFCDREMISTVLRNLIANSIKFTPKGGKIIVSAESRNSGTKILVSDNGIGIGKDLIGKLFRIEESFTTAGTEGEQGTGMGLLLCHDFISKHGGEIWVESEPGQGSTFIFTLPETMASLHSNS
jgi:PAS domain S-box-containing protein